MFGKIVAKLRAIVYKPSGLLAVVSAAILAAAGFSYIEITNILAYELPAFPQASIMMA